MSCEIKRILQFQTAVQFGELKVFDNKEKDITFSCMYSWSIDKVCWTNWTGYNNYLQIAKNIETDFYLRILLFGSFSKVSLNGLFTNCYNITVDSTNQFLIDFCGTENLFNPYSNLDCALLLQQQLSDNIVCMFGVPIYYFKVSPQATTVDYTFKEYVMHNVESVKQMQLMIPDGTMPSSKPNFSEWDFDFEVDWEVELGKTQFAKAFGDNAFPKQRDFIYIPMMKRMWEVNSAYDEKNEGLMWRSTTWKLGLVKYNDKTNVTKEGFDEMLDTLIINKYEDVFGVLEGNEQERSTGITQISKPDKSATNLTNIFLQDAIRKAMTKDTIQILDKQYNHKSIVITKNQYRFVQEDSTITYQKGICGDNGMISFILETEEKKRGEQILLDCGEIKIKSKDMTIIFGNLQQELQTNSSYLVILKWNRKNFTTELNIYNYIKPVGIPEYKIRPEMYMFDFDNPVCELLGEYNNDYNINKEHQITFTGYPFLWSNIRYYNESLNREEGIKEGLKYTTTSSNCIFNDLCRRLDDGHGYAIK